jgi:predicted phage tail protein
MAETLYASFVDSADAVKAAGALMDHGVRQEDLTLIAHATEEEARRYTGEEIREGTVDTVTETETSRRYRRAEARDEDQDRAEGMAKGGLSTTTGEDAASGAAKGAGWGLGVGAAAALASLFVPGFGLVLGGGALATALTGAALATAGGAIAGGVTGYLKDQGMPADVSATYGEVVEHGGAILAVQLPSGDVDQATAEGLLAKYAAANIGTYDTRIREAELVTS